MMVALEKLNAKIVDLNGIHKLPRLIKAGVIIIRNSLLSPFKRSALSPSVLWWVGDNDITSSLSETESIKTISTFQLSRHIN